MFSLLENDFSVGSKEGTLPDGASGLLGNAPINDIGQLSQSLPVESPIDLSAVPVTSVAEIFSVDGLATELGLSESATAQDGDSLLTGGLTNQASLNNAVGTFTVGDKGQVEIDFLYDGGGYAGELAVFSLDGMDGLSPEAFIQEAAARSLSDSSKGQVAIADTTQGAQFSGKLGGPDYNKGPTASTQVLNLAAGSRFALMLAPNGTIADAIASDQTPLFSIAAFNPNGGTQFGQAAEGIFGIEDLVIGQGDADFNDTVFQIKGATGTVTDLDEVINPAKEWRDRPLAQSFLESPQFSGPDEPLPPTKSPTPESPIDEQPPVDEKPPVSEKPPVDEIPVAPPVKETPMEGTPPINEKPPVEERPIEERPIEEKPVTPPAPPSNNSKFVSDISGAVNKFTPGTSEAELIASGADRIKIGTQTIYIGTEQVTSINQNPIIRSIDSVNPSNNWLRTDVETTGTDGRGLGIAWTGSALYGVFSVDGTQGTPSQDFRRASGGAQQNWLKSFGPGGGKRIAVIGQLDPATGTLLKAAHLSAVLENGQTNSLSVKGITTNSAGNLVVSASSFSNPRKPDGTALTRNPGNTAGSPFDYTLELTPDLSRVVSTSAKGWS